MWCVPKVEETELGLTVWAYCQEGYYLRDRHWFSKMGDAVLCQAHLREAQWKRSSGSANLPDAEQRGGKSQGNKGHFMLWVSFWIRASWLVVVVLEAEKGRDAKAV